MKQRVGPSLAKGGSALTTYLGLFPTIQKGRSTISLSLEAEKAIPQEITGVLIFALDPAGWIGFCCGILKDGIATHSDLASCKIFYNISAGSRDINGHKTSHGVHTGRNWCMTRKPRVIIPIRPVVILARHGDT
eukprot:1196060-Prorocentrum_minimum.AAC.2